MENDEKLRWGAILMTAAAVAFVGYGVLFAIMNFTAAGFELGVDSLDGADRDSLAPAVSNYIGHLHLATAAFIISTGIAVAALAWYGVRHGQMWAWTTSVVSAVVGLAIALPMHYTGGFEYDWVLHLGPIYLATIVFVVGALLALGPLMASSRPPGAPAGSEAAP